MQQRMKRLFVARNPNITRGLPGFLSEPADLNLSAPVFSPTVPISLWVYGPPDASKGGLTEI